MVIRSELYDNHNIYRVDIGDKIKYAYSIPYCYPGDVRLDNNNFLLYEITSERYVELMMLKRKGVAYCADYIYSNFDEPLIKGENIEGFTYKGDTGRHFRPICSKVLQMMIEI